MIIITDFGFNEIMIGSIKVYTGKLKFKDITFEPQNSGLKVSYSKNYCIISYETIDIELSKVLKNRLWKIAEEVAQFRLDNKYKQRK